ncbi:hypothetical protein [Pseudalkalibacillus decolorationis]|uniref:hypothetical protein n=1 Tax=Pseudalkalibacillus decolorationis TaxID=163879 RepID=UPI0021482898|nr:hypothetical protein [Pseudalkalibacillus decolorationis]
MGKKKNQSTEEVDTNEENESRRSVHPWDAMWGFGGDRDGESEVEEDTEREVEEGEGEEEQEERRDPWLW